VTVFEFEESTGYQPITAYRVQNSSRLPAIAGSFSTFADDFVIGKKRRKNDSDQ
jgi:hypothetical protein